MTPCHAYSFLWASLHSLRDPIPADYYRVLAGVEHVVLHGILNIRLSYWERRVLFQCPFCEQQVKCCPACYATFCLINLKAIHKPSCPYTYNEHQTTCGPRTRSGSRRTSYSHTPPSFFLGAVNLPPKRRHRPLLASLRLHHPQVLLVVYLSNLSATGPLAGLGTPRRPSVPLHLPRSATTTSNSPSLSDAL